MSEILVTVMSKEQQPLTETTFFILLSFSDQPKHGYAIMKDVETLSANRVSLSTGTLYGALKRLLENGWITRKEGDSPSNNRDQKTYELTDLGRRLLNGEAQRLESLIATIRLRIGKQNA
jgi:DNA-binding PadR family transcriptional regulator